MPRRANVEKRIPLPDPIHGRQDIAKFINCLMLNGKRSVAERIVYGALEKVEKTMKKDAVEIFEQALRNATPVLEVKPRRVGGATYQVPVEIRPDRRTALARRWMIRFARQRAGKSMSDKLAAELMDAYNGVGATLKRKDETHKMAESNKAFSHFRY